MSKEISEIRVDIAAKISSGLLSSQDPKTGWNLDTLAILSLKIADNIIYYSKLEKLPDLIPAPKQEENK